jgi:cellulose synthase/poly-beta-1,6-N-acetylglucosamine synthase-like glycosyltransferase
MGFFLHNVYLSILGILAIYGIHRMQLVLMYIRRRGEKTPLPPLNEPLPQLTVQLPIFNERYVACRLIEAVSKFDYPKDRMEIQVLDDSTDETVQLVSELVSNLAREGWDIRHIHRSSRKGFKAGALKNGLQQARGEFIAVFDADFIPHSDILKKLIPYFSDPGIGMVQARWGHINQDYSLLTRVQSLILDSHFIVDQVARNRTGRFFNFNGTAGIWRKQCIEDAGGWHEDTLTEDLDLSYRAQLAGWRFLMVPGVVVPAELPVEVGGFLRQQFRWAKGAIQTLRKQLGRILKSPIPFCVKLEATLHLTNNLVYPLSLILAVLILPVMLLRSVAPSGTTDFLELILFIIITGSIFLYYGLSIWDLYPDNKRRWLFIPVLMSIGLGLGVNNSRAVLEALVGWKSPFHRTPKYGIMSDRDQCHGKIYYKKSHRYSYPEILLGGYLSWTLWVAARQGAWVTIPFLLLYVFGFFYVGFFSLDFLRMPKRALSPRFSPTP